MINKLEKGGFTLKTTKSLTGASLPPVGGRFALTGGRLAPVGGRFALTGASLPPVGARFALTGGRLAPVGGRFAPVMEMFAKVLENSNLSTKTNGSYAVIHSHRSLVKANI
jgi:hypothetical protein